MHASKETLSAPTATAFRAGQLIASGSLIEVALTVKQADASPASEPILVFDDASGEVIDLDLRGEPEEISERLKARSGLGDTRASPSADAIDGHEAEERRGRGRPKLGVVAKEVTLLPRHWEWLASQRGGASAALRRLVEEACRGGASNRARRRSEHEVAYRVMAALAGDWPGFEEAARALFADDEARFANEVAPWPSDARAYVLRLAFGGRKL